MQPHNFHEIQYHNQHVEIDFFRSLGRTNLLELNAYWYKDKNGNLSPCANHLTENTAEWRDNYWKKYYESLSIKLEEWKYEKEYRLIINGGFIDYSLPEKRKLKYDFTDLQGIIFGIKTLSTDKFKIIDIIKEKCKKENRQDFEFYQSFYSKSNGKIENYKLDLLKFD